MVEAEELQDANSPLVQGATGPCPTLSGGRRQPPGRMQDWGNKGGRGDEAPRLWEPRGGVGAEQPLQGHGGGRFRTACAHRGVEGRDRRSRGAGRAVGALKALPGKQVRDVDYKSQHAQLP